MLGESVLSGQRPALSRVNFEIGDEEAPVAKHVVVGESLCGQSQTENERTGTDIGLLEIESITRVVTAEHNPGTVGVIVQQVEQAGVSGSFPRVSDGIGTRLRRYYPSKSAKTLFKEFFEQNLPAALDGTHTTTSLSAYQLIQFARAVDLEVSLASCGMLEDVLLKPNVGQSAGPRTHRAGDSPYPSRCGSTVMESVASPSSYSLPTITEAGENAMVRVGSIDNADDREQLVVYRPHGATDEKWSLERTVHEDFLTLS